tara:strand:- start:121 stop:756 length:636 start_codon:yes stop_codon:yes gene_type:complete
MNLKPPNYWDKEIKRLLKRIKTHNRKENLIVFYGSSTIRLWVHLSKDLSPHNVINLGFGGSSYAWCLRYFNILFDTITPQRIIFYAGENDLGEGLTIQQVLDNFRMLVEKAKLTFPKAKISVISIKPSPNRKRLSKKFIELNSMYKKYISSIEGGTYIDLYHPMLNQMGSIRSELYLSDGLHLSRLGYEIWSSELKKFLNLQEKKNEQNCK